MKGLCQVCHSSNVEVTLETGIPVCTVCNKKNNSKSKFKNFLFFVYFDFADFSKKTGY
jgi:hypothetical protein